MVVMTRAQITSGLCTKNATSHFRPLVSSDARLSAAALRAPSHAS
jgi:hypothetical protein